MPRDLTFNAPKQWESRNPFADSDDSENPFEYTETRSLIETSSETLFELKEPVGFDRYPNLGEDAGQDFSPFGGYPAHQFPLDIDEQEDDDYLHNPGPDDYDKHRMWNDLKSMDRRLALGLAGIVVLCLGAAAVFVLFPILTYAGVTNPIEPEVYENLSPYKYPLLKAIRTELVDPDTPEDALTAKNAQGDEWDLVFSDEFAVEGRTFYEGDDQFFTAPDFHYAATEDLEWYDPDAVTTANGTLTLTMDAYKNHDLFYRSGMLQLWNKMCFSGGMIMILAKLPFYGSVLGLWPGLWTMGNLGRPGYLATTDGVWPYTYDSCDAGITANQLSPDGISYLPGQRLSQCVCAGEDHPNVGTGRGAPEVDIIEGATDVKLKVGVASQSYQIAPMDVWYYIDYSFVAIHDKDVTSMNTYTGGPFQQAVSGTTTLNPKWYEKGKGAGKYQVYGFELDSDNDDGYITWYVGDPTLTVHAKALAPNGNVGWRRIAKEPMSVVMNMGLSNSWAYIDWTSLSFPVHMNIDYVRVYQDKNKQSVTCDPDDYPTSEYIENHLDAYQNPNHTKWKDAGYETPKNKLIHGC